MTKLSAYRGGVGYNNFKGDPWIAYESPNFMREIHNNANASVKSRRDAFVE